MTSVAKLTDNVWHISGPPHVLLKLKGMFPKIKKHEFGTVKLQNSPEVSKDLLWFSQRYDLQFEPYADALSAAAIYDERQRHLLALQDPNFKPAPCVMAHPLRHYQEIGVAQALNQSSLLLADDVGLGKTVTALGLFSKTTPAIVVCPAHLCRQWRDEATFFLPNSKPHIAKTVAPYALPEGTDLLILTYAKLHGWAEHLRSNPFQLVIFDEVQDLRHSGSGKYMAAKAIAAVTPYRLGLSATPIHNFGDEIFNIYEVLRPGMLGTHSEFMREWCSGYGKGVTDPEAMGSYLRSQGAMLRRTKSDVGRELPKVQKLVYPIDADKKTFEKMAGNAAELARLILSQSTSFVEKGRASRELDMRLRQATGVSKAPAVAEFTRILAEEVGKVVLIGWHRAVFKVWLEALADLRPVMYTGSESPAQKEAATREFIEGSSQIFILSLRAGVGLDGLQHCCADVVFGELDWSPSVHHQNIGRVSRDGQTKPVNAYYLVSDEGSDPVLSSLLGVKQAQHDGIVELGQAEVLASIPESRIKEMAENFLSRHR